NETEKDLPHRTALTERILKQYTEVRKALLAEFKARSSLPKCVLFLIWVQRAEGQIHFTADVWSDGNLTAFMAITSHFCIRDE
ncbi:hypothetical protein C8J57DRAFT_1027229, partial [Mycena rebaudengoi]